MNNSWKSYPPHPLAEIPSSNPWPRCTQVYLEPIIIQSAAKSTSVKINVWVVYNSLYITTVLLSFPSSSGNWWAFRHLMDVAPFSVNHTHRDLSRFSPLLLMTQKQSYALAPPPHPLPPPSKLETHTHTHKSQGRTWNKTDFLHTLKKKKRKCQPHFFQTKHLDKTNTFSNLGLFYPT